VTFAFAITTLVTLQRLQGMPMTVTTVDMDLRSEKALTVRSPSMGFGGPERVSNQP
jgi:hypothetical protein